MDVICSENDIKIYKWKIREGFRISNNQVILLYELINGTDKEIKRFKATKIGIARKRLFKDGDIVNKDDPILELELCEHTTVINDMCADCGADLTREDNMKSEASVPMIHSIPELKVSQKLAEKLGKEDTERLIKDRKLVLLVDLDQTLIHTTNDNIPNNLKNVYHFQLYGARSPWYHTRLRPGTFEFLNNIAPYYELHICTFGARNYAHMICTFLDKDGKYFSHRILSRDECFNLTSKTDNLKALFPCGDSMVCIIDDREDVWNMAANLIQVKPYHFFQHTGDINAPPGLEKHELDGQGVNFNDFHKKLKKMKNEKPSVDDKKQSTSETAQLKQIKEITPKSSIESCTSSTTSTSTSTSRSTLTTTDKDDSSKAKNTEESIISNENTEAVCKDQKLDNHIEENDKQIKEPSKNRKIKKSQTLDKKNKQKKKNTSTDCGAIKNLHGKKVSSDTATDDDHLIDVEDPDDYLLYLEAILKKIHDRFYNYFDENNKLPDLKLLVPNIKSEVLVGTTLVFSGLIPNRVKLEQSRAYLIAKSLGAQVKQQLTDETTHLVAATPGTLKVNAARKRNICIVTPDWLWSCAERWECVEPKLFPLDPHKPSAMRKPPAHCHSPEHNISTNSNDRSDLDDDCDGPEPKFIDTINPLMKFSNADLAAMNQEFNQFFESDSSSSDDEPVDMENPPLNKQLRKRKREEEKEETQRKFFQKDESNEPFTLHNTLGKEEDTDNNKNSSSDDEMPSTKFRRGGDLPSDLSDCGSVGSDDPIDEDDDGDWNMMGAALEREFLGLE